MHTWWCLVFVPCQIPTVGPRRKSPNHLYGAPICFSLSQTTCDEAFSWEILIGLCGKTDLLPLYLLWEICSARQLIKGFEVLQ